MKASRIIALIIAIALGIIIASQVKQNKTTSQESKPLETNVTQSGTTKLDTEKTVTDKIPAETTLSNTDSSETSDKTITSDVASDSTKQLETPKIDNKTPMITLKTNKGDIEIALNTKEAPLTTENFLKYAKQGQYNGTIFHRVIKGFMIQGGGFEAGMEQKEVGGPIPNEANNGLKNDKYTVAMARTSDPHSATAQFFINATNNDFLNFTSESQSGWGYAVFGEVVNGKEVVDAIEQVATSRAGHHGDVPVEDVVIESVVIAD